MKKKNYIYLFIIILILIIIYFVFFRNNSPETIYQIREGKLFYSQNRGNPTYEMVFRSDNKTFEMYNVSYNSRDFLNYKTKLYALLILPKNKTNVPGIIYLPAGAARKEQIIEQASLYANEGYAVLIIDQRGIGETGGYYLGFEDDYKLFLQGKEPVQHLSVYDALVSFDVFRNIKNIDKNNIVIIGESMGGRYAIIAAAIDKRIKGVIGISTSGFHVKNDNSPESKFFLSIDPDNYISSISPNYVIMLHGRNDSVINIDDSKYTFSLSKEPKKYFIFPKCEHGYFPEMENDLKSSLKLIFNK